LVVPSNAELRHVGRPDAAAIREVYERDGELSAASASLFVPGVGLGWSLAAKPDPSKAKVKAIADAITRMHGMGGLFGRGERSESAILRSESALDLSS
jgi:hypothetical protein